MSIKTLKTLVLAGILSIAAMSAAQAGGKVVGSDFHANVAPSGGTARSGQIPTLWRRVLAGGKPTGMDFHANAAPACGHECPVLAGDASGVGGDIRASLTHTGRSGQRAASFRQRLDLRPWIDGKSFTLPFRKVYDAKAA